MTSQIADKSPEKVDVAVNVFAKPFQTALSLLSLAASSGSHIGTFWLQYEPVGSQYDYVPPYLTARYLTENLGFDVKLSQPDFWLDLEAPDESRLDDIKYRMAIRYQHAFENSNSRLLFLMHNDVFIFKDILGALKEGMGDAFAIGQLGQCWNCPASNAELTMSVMGCAPCKPDSYQDFKPSRSQLDALYKLAKAKNIFVRPYDTDNFYDEFEKQPWPLPECRVNEWICLIDLARTRPLTFPFGEAWPPGAYKKCGSHNLDIITTWFRAMHAHGFHARNFNIQNYVKHWVGTGKNTPLRYAKAEDNALNILRKHFPDYLEWLARETGNKNLVLN